MKNKVPTGDSEVSEVPPDLPASYPGELKVQTQSIIVNAIKKFPKQKQTVERCKYVISELTPLFFAAICNKELSARLAESRMVELLRSLVSDNRRSQNGVTHERKLRGCEEWLKLLHEIGRAEKYAPE